MRAASDRRQELMSNLANINEVMEDLYLHAVMGKDEVDGGADYQSCPILGSISTEEIQSSLRRMVLARRVMPTMCGAALCGMGVEPILDCVAEYRECGHFCLGLSMWVYVIISLTNLKFYSAVYFGSIVVANQQNSSTTSKLILSGGSVLQIHNTGLKPYLAQYR